MRNFTLKQNLLEDKAKRGQLSKVSSEGFLPVSMFLQQLDRLLVRTTCNGQLIHRIKLHYARF